MSDEIKVIEVHDPRSLPQSYFPFIGTLEQAKAAIIKDRTSQPERRIFPEGVNTIVHFISRRKSGWHIIAIDPEPHVTPASIIVEGDDVV